jgi:hypothetical protein
MDMRHERGDLSKDEKKAQKRIKMSKEAMAEELESDSDAMEMEGGVLENPIDVLVGMNHKGNHRIPSGMGESIPLLYGGIDPGDIPDDDAALFGEAYAWALVQAMDFTDRQIPFDPQQLGADSLEKVLTEGLQDSSEDRVIVAPKEAAHPPPPKDQYLNFPTSSEPSELAPLEGGSKTLHGGRFVTVKDLKIGDAYTFRLRDTHIPFEFIGTVKDLQERVDARRGGYVTHPVAIVVLDKGVHVDPIRYKPGKVFAVTDELYQIKDDVKESEKHAAEAIGRVHTAIPASAIGNIAEFLGHKGAIGDLVRAEVADKGRPGDDPSVLRPREETGLVPAPAPAPAPESQKRPLEKADQPPTKRQKQGGEKPKRKVSEWSLLIQKVFKELREKDPTVTIAMAAKEASRRRKVAT